MLLTELYEKVGGNYEEARGRLMNDRLIDKFVLKFLNDPTMESLKAAVAAGQISESFRAAHTLKGVAANLSFTALSQAASALTEQLRPLAQTADPGLYAAVCDMYDRTAAAIREYAAQKG